ncbi:MAG: carboxypeptidase regulatory-like domain-containing protein [Infirmifilum sp.]
MSGKRGLALLFVILAITTLASQCYGQQFYFYGVVTDTHSNPLPGVEVAVFSNNLLVASTTTDSSGLFNLRIPAGTYILRAYLKGYTPKQFLLVASQEKAGSLGTIMLEPAINMYTESTQMDVYQGDYLNLTIKVSNKGLDPLLVFFTIEAPTSWNVNLVLPEGLRVNNVLVEAGAERTLFLNVRVPVNALGKNTIRVTASWVNLSTSINYVFNVLPKRWDIISLPATGIKAYPGAQLRIPFQLINPFPVDADITISVDSPPEWVATILDVNSITVSRISLVSKASSQLFLVLYIPPSTRPGAYKVTLFTDILGSRYSANLDVNIESRYDLLNLTAGITRLNLSGGVSTVVPLFVRNDGNMPTIALISVNFNSKAIRAVLSTSSQPVSTFYLLPGESRQVNLILNATTSAAPGVYEVKVRVNGTVSYDEKTILVNIAGVYRFQILNQNFMVTTPPGSASVYTLRVNNTGTYALTLATRILSAPENFQVIAKPDQLSLLPGETGAFTIQISVPPDTPEGVYNVVVRIESGSLAETRVIIVWVRTETSLSFTLIMFALVAVSFFLVYYGKRRYS